MTEKLADSDIDKFIRDQKSKLTLEKRELDNEEEYQRTTRRRWAEPDKENYNYGVTKEPDARPDLLRPETPARQGYPVDNRQVIKQRKQLSEQRKQEYNDYLKSHVNNRRQPRNLTPTQKSIQVGNPNDRRKAELKTERRNDYKEYLNREKRKPRKFPGRRHPMPETRRVPYEPRSPERVFYDPRSNYSDDMPANVDLRLRLELDSSDEYYPVETETPKAASLPIGQYEIQRKEQAPEIKRRYREDLEQQLREKDRMNRNRSGNKQKLEYYGKARHGPKLDAFKRQIRVQGSPRKSAEKFGEVRKPPADYRNIKTYTEYNNSQSKYRFKNQYDYEQWQRKQIAALNDIERRQQELRLKLARDQTIRELERDLLPQEECEVEIQTQRLIEKNRSPSPHVDPPLYDPIEGELLHQSARNSPEGLLIPENSNREKAEKLRRERQQDYQDMMAQRNGDVRTWREPSREEILLDDKRETIRKKLEEERKNEYNEYLKNNSYTRNNDLPPKPGTPGGFLNTLGSHEKQRQKLKEERHEEYKRLQAEKMGLTRDFTDPRMLHAKDCAIYATLPGMNYYGSATRGENEPPGAPRKGWGTPTYEEMLEKKRNEEQKYRRLNDPDYSRQGMKSYNSESALHRLENELPPRGRGVQPQAVHEYPPRGIREAPTYLPESNKHRFYATLPIGQEDQDEFQKRKAEYKQDLMRQMKEAEDARKKNKQDFIEQAPSPERQHPQASQAPPAQKVIIIPNKQLPDVIPPQQQQYQLTSGIDRLGPRSEMLLGRTKDLERLERRLKKIEQQNAAINPLDIAELDFISKRDPRIQMFPSGPSGPSGTGILEQGFDRLLEPPKVGSVKAPVGLEYTPSTYVTGGENFDKFSSVDKAYHYYGSHNPLDTGISAPTQLAATNYGSVPTGNQIVVDNYRAAPGGGGLGGGGYSSPVLGQPNAAAIQENINQGNDAERKAKQRAQAQQYQRELERQMEEKKFKKAIEREERERYERKLEDDIRNYNPFGRGGAGAPMKDEYGNVVADLRAKNKGYSPRYEPMSSPTRAGPKDDLIKTPPAQTTVEGESTYARGGHGIFGHPKTEAEKSQADKYKEELKRQIDNKKREAEMEKDRERREEERQQKIIDDQRRKMQEEYDEEKRRIQAKQDEQDRKNAEIIKLQEDQKMKEEDLRGEKKKRVEARLEYERQRDEREEYDYRSDSPLIPTLRHRNLEIYSDNAPPARNNSADVLNQLAHMRRQLQSERKRVENLLEETLNEPEVFDPRLVQRPPQQQIPVVQSRNDIFETALNRNAVHVRRGGTADMKILQEFDDLKYKEDTDSRKQFRKLYPVDPRSQDDLESQQAALIRQQEERLRRLADSPIDLPGSSTSPQTMLHSNSAFIDVEGMDRSLFPDDFDDFPKRNESARDRRRQAREADRYPSKSPRDTSTDLPRNYDPMGSVVSLDVDRIQRKNDDRLKRLKEIQGDDVSLYDPDDVLNRFMEKQSHNSHYDLDTVSRILTPE